MIMDCPDGSDENHCDNLNMEVVDYLRNLPPPLAQSDANNVFFNITILSLPAIDTVGQKITCRFALALRWRDSRLNFANLNSDISLNVLSEEALTMFWAPKITFSNALGNYQTVVDDLTHGVLVMEGEGVETGVEEATEGSNMVVLLDCTFFLALIMLIDTYCSLVYL